MGNLAATLKAIADRPPRQPASKLEFEREVTDLIKRVADRRLRVKPVMKVAAAVVDGELPRDVLDEFFRQLDRADAAGELRRDDCPRWAYFVGGMENKVFPAFNLNWNAQPKPR
jgi:hypothetical protein